MVIHGVEVKGKVVDEKTRCVHYHKDIDVIAIKFYCCQTYYPCYECHQEDGCGDHQVWPNEKFHERAILCGGCGAELTIEEYLNCAYKCPICKISFNPGCGRHRHYYFEV